MQNDHPNQKLIEKWLRLHLVAGVGSKTFARLLKRLGGIDQILAATPGQLASIPGIGQKKAQAITAGLNSADVNAELEKAEHLGIRIITQQCPDYPPLLRQIDTAPAVLYVKGTLTDQDNLAVAFVGSRNCSNYGREQTSRLTHMLSTAGFTIVSGLARGIDTEAHRGALSADGRTIAVLGCGLGKIYPPENADLADRIADNGCLVSELPIDYEPLSNTFPARNRIIAGLSLATVVVEARHRSGALITARLALEQNRDVMAVPGRIDSPNSQGPHQLIKDGAQLVENVNDILAALGHLNLTIDENETTDSTQPSTTSDSQPALFNLDQLKLSPTESAVLNSLDHQEIHIDEIINRANLTAGPTNAALTSLQLKGLIKQLPGSFYKKQHQ